MHPSILQSPIHSPVTYLSSHSFSHPFNYLFISCTLYIYIYNLYLYIIYIYYIISVFDKLIWPTIGPNSFLFCTAQFSHWASGAVNYDYIVTNSINSLLIDSMAHTLTIVEPIWPMLQNVSKL